MALDLLAVDALAVQLHAGQVRRHAAPYIEHPRAVLRIATLLAAACGVALSDAARAAALLHDVIEDSDIGVEGLRARVGAEVTERVVILTKLGKNADAHDAYWRALRTAPDEIRLLKVADRCHNLSELHKTGRGADEAARLKRYVDETLEHVLPLAAFAPGLTAALADAMRAACGAMNVAPPPTVRALLPTQRLGVYAIVDGPSAVPALCDAGVSVVQLRNKAASDDVILAQLAQMRAVCAGYDVTLIVNDRADLCVRAEVGGVHVGQRDAAPEHVRGVVGAHRVVGVSTHSVAQFDAAAQQRSADYIAVGPVFPSTTKAGIVPIVGVQALQARVASTTLPVVAIGGVTTTDRVARVAAAGAHYVATVSPFVGDVDVHGVARELSLAFFAGRARPDVNR